MKKFLVATLALLSVCASAQVLVKSDADVFVQNRKHHSWTFPGVDVANGRVVVDFLHRIDYPRLGGWCPCWQITVNGKVLTASASRTETRLLNKPFSIVHSWFGKYQVDNRSDKWYSIYQPNFHDGDVKFRPVTTEASRVVLDISDLVKLDGTNEVTVSAGGLSETHYRSSGVLDRKPAVVFGNFEVRQDKEPTRLSRVEEKTPRAVFSPPSPPTEFALSRGGSGKGGPLTLESMGISIPLESRFSLPGGGMAEMKSRKSLDTAFYSVRRKIFRRGNRIDFFDTFVSKTNELIGVRVRYEIPLAGFGTVYVAGDPSPCAEEFEGGRNPSVFGIHGRGGAVALIAQDDVFRVQSVQYCKDGHFGVRTDTMALQPGRERTVEWSVYPVASGDYYDFVNMVRNDWDVNFPIAGSFNLSMNCYKNNSRETSVRWSANMGLGMNTFGCHFWSHIGGKYAEYKDCIWGIGKSSPLVRVKIDNRRSVLEDPEVMNEFERMCIRKCRDFTPHVKVLTYLHNQISVDAGDEKYEECRMVNAKGRKMNYNGGATQKIFVPTADNLFGRDFMKLTDWYLDSFDVDGIYLDEINHCNSRKYYGDKLWDGASVELDERNNVKAKVSFVSLLKLEFTLGLFDHILNRRGKILVGNFSPETRSERKFRFPRFEETYSHRWIALSHLYTPIQLGDMLTYGNNPKDMAADQREALKRGALYYHYLGSTGCPSLSSKMFPFTPVELHSGWLVGKERILTCISGEFGWRGERPDVEVFVYDELGRHVPGYPCSIVEKPLGRAFVLELKKDHCAAIVRK